MCEGPDLNRGTPARTDLESVAFDRAWLPSHGDFVRPGWHIKDSFFADSTATMTPITVVIVMNPGKSQRIDGSGQSPDCDDCLTVRVKPKRIKDSALILRMRTMWAV